MKKVTITIRDSYITLSNGIVKLTISKPDGALTTIQYGGFPNILDANITQSQRGYWDVNWNLPGGHDRYQLVEGTEFSVVSSKDDVVEISFRSSWSPSKEGRTSTLPLTVDKRFILRSGISGFYSYAILEKSAGWPSFDLSQARMVFILRRDVFHYMAITDEKQKLMPMPQDIIPPRGQVLALPESVLLVDPTNPILKNQVDDKYQYSMDNKDGGLHGWISSGPYVGFWVIFPSSEYRNGGPTKQNLTVHTGPTALAMFHGTHYIGKDIVASFSEDESWRKVLGPIFIYLNSTSHLSDVHNLWKDAKRQRLSEVADWPYDFVSSPYFLSAQERGSASGKLYVQDRYVSQSLIVAKSAYVGLAATTGEGSWQTESKGYQFWAQADSEGAFTIKNIVPGVYAVHGWVPGFMGDYLHGTPLTISAGSEAKLGNLVFSPQRHGPTMWEIGYPDRTAIGFFVPDPYPQYVNKLYINSPEKYRQYGLWDRYADMHRTSDQVFTIGVNDSKKDWFFAQVTRKTGPKAYSPTTWTIKFNLDQIKSGIYILRLALAASNHSWLQVRVNNPNGEKLLEDFDMGSDNTIGRHGIHGFYRLLNISIDSSILFKGDNSLFLSQARGGNELIGLYYDYVRLEGPTTST